MAKFKSLPPVERVQALLDYNPQTGRLHWKIAAAKWIKPGDEAGTYAKRAIDVTIDRKSYRAHRLIWLLVNRHDPGAALVDHIDGNYYNNKIENLRLTTTQENACNQRRRIDNTSGYKGVSWDKNRNSWQASIFVNQQRIFLGRYALKEDAYAAYCAAALNLHGEFARLA